MDEVGFLLHWHGPFSSISDAREWLRATKHEEGIYIAFGYRGRARIGRPSLEYVGVSSNLLSRLNGSHSTLRKIDISSIWISQPANYEKSRKEYRSFLEVCEWIIVHALEPAANDKKLTPPKISTSIINKFWTPDADLEGVWSIESKAARPEYVPDLIYYDHYEDRVWYVRLESSTVHVRDNIR